MLSSSADVSTACPAGPGASLDLELLILPLTFTDPSLTCCVLTFVTVVRATFWKVHFNLLKYHTTITWAAEQPLYGYFSVSSRVCVQSDRSAAIITFTVKELWNNIPLLPHTHGGGCRAFLCLEMPLPIPLGSFGMKASFIYYVGVTKKTRFREGIYWHDTKI